RDIAAYRLATDLDNNVYGLDNNLDQRQIWRTNAETGETTYIDLQPRVGGDSQNRQWFPQFHANRYAVYGPKSSNVAARRPRDEDVSKCRGEPARGPVASAGASQ